MGLERKVRMVRRFRRLSGVFGAAMFIAGLGYIFYGISEANPFFFSIGMGVFNLSVSFIIMRSVSTIALYLYEKECGSCGG